MVVVRVNAFSLESKCQCLQRFQLISRAASGGALMTVYGWFRNIFLPYSNNGSFIALKIRVSFKAQA